MSGSTRRPLTRFKIPDEGLPRAVVGQEARTLRALQEAGPRGITSGEVSKMGWGFRLAHYVMKLRRHGLQIVMAHEDHPEGMGGWHGRYTLETPIEILETEPAGAA